MSGVLCSEKACPFTAETGSLLCRHHRQTFSYGITLEDRGFNLNEIFVDGVAQGFSFSGATLTNDSALVKRVKREGLDSDLLHRNLGSGVLLPGLLKVLDAASAGMRKELFTKDFAAYELLTGVRFPGGVFCLICGSSDTKPYISGIVGKFWKCRVCGYNILPHRQTVFHGSQLTVNHWLSALWIKNTTPSWGVVSRIEEEGIYKRSASRMNRTLEVAARLVGIEIKPPGDTGRPVGGIIQIGSRWKATASNKYIGIYDTEQQAHEAKVAYLATKTTPRACPICNHGPHDGPCESGKDRGRCLCPGVNDLCARDSEKIIHIGSGWKSDSECKSKLYVSERDSVHLREVLENPPAPNEALRKLFKK